MIWILRNISIHLWLAVLFAIPTVFVLLLFSYPLFPGIDPVVAAAGLVVTVFLLFGAIMDTVAKRLLSRLIKEGQAWERAGLTTKAKKAYQRAVRIYDTFLLWPLFTRRAVGRICGAIARFQVNNPQDHPGFNRAFTLYVKLYPDDEDLVLPWVKQLSGRSAISAIEQDVLTRLAGRKYGNTAVTDALADIFLRLERRDYAARKLYRHATEKPQAAEMLSPRIEALVGEPDIEGLERQAPEVSQTISVPKRIRIREVAGAVAARGRTALTMTGSFLSEITSRVWQSAVQVTAWFKKTPKARMYLKTAFLCLACLWLTFFMVNTIAHLFKSRTVEQGEAKTMEVAVPKPFTIQVAAYLKLSHADRYVAILKKKGIEAHVKKVAGGGKTWYLVRVSQFVNKKSAAEYGRQLKNKKIIDDFFVSNK